MAVKAMVSLIAIAAATGGCRADASRALVPPTAGTAGQQTETGGASAGAPGKMSQDNRGGAGDAIPAADAGARGGAGGAMPGAGGAIGTGGARSPATAEGWAVETSLSRFRAFVLPGPMPRPGPHPFPPAAQVRSTSRRKH